MDSEKNLGVNTSLGVKVLVRRLDPRAKLPSYAHLGDAGMDLYSCEEVIIPPKERRGIHTGISMEFPKGYVALLWDKSGLALKEGITVLGGVIDAGYRGEYIAILYNTSEVPYVVGAGDKVCQILIQKVENAHVSEVDSLEDSSRGAGAFGSTGQN